MVSAGAPSTFSERTAGATSNGTKNPSATILRHKLSPTGNLVPSWLAQTQRRDELTQATGTGARVTEVTPS